MLALVGMYTSVDQNLFIHGKERNRKMEETLELFVFVWSAL